MKGRDQMDKFESLSHTAWDCKYHVIFIPKRRRRTLYGELRKHLGEVLRKLAAQKESQIVEGHLMPDHVHMMIAIPPKYSLWLRSAILHSFTLNLLKHHLFPQHFSDLVWFYSVLPHID